MSLVVDPPAVAPVAPAPVVMLPDECPLSGHIRNFKVECAAFGAYKRGSILPKHILLRSAGAGALGREDTLIAGMLTSRKFTQTYEPVNVQLAEVKVKGGDQVVPDLTRDVNESRAKLKTLQQDHIAACAERDSWKNQIASRDKSLGEQAGQIANLQAELAARNEIVAKAQAEIAVLTRQLDEATKPQTKGAK